jgi:hypothetical protein
MNEPHQITNGANESLRIRFSGKTRFLLTANLVAWIPFLSILLVNISSEDCRLIGVPNGTETSTYAANRPDNDARRLDRDVDREGPRFTKID